MTHSPQASRPLAAAEPSVDEATTPPNNMKRVAAASFIGTMIEFYDFGIYGTAAALVFPQIFFPALGPAAGTIASFAALGVAFVARPFGSILFGHLGDRLGRKKTLIATMLLMGISTILVGLMPTAAQIGVAAPILVIALRVLQGLAAGGEFAGAVLFSSENAPKGKRGFWAMMPSLGGSGAIILSSTTFFLTSLFMSPETFGSWGWRIPFLASFLLVIVGLWVRLSMDETPVFRNQVAHSGTARIPLLEAVKAQPRQILLATGTTTMVFSLTYISVVYLVSYGTAVLELSSTVVLGTTIIGGLAMSAGVIIGARLSDRIGRRSVIGGAACVAILWALALFPILDLRSPLSFALGLLATMFLSGIATGPLGAFLSELFHTRYRYTAAAVSHSLAGVLGGGIPPLIAAWVVATLGGFAFGVTLAGVCLMSLVCMLAIGETRHLDLEPAPVPVQAS
jgi:MFS family permease